MNERDFAAQALHREIQAREQERRAAERIALEHAKREAARAAEQHARNNERWRNNTIQDLGRLW